MAIDGRYLANIRGKMFVTYAGALDAATNNGLRSLVTRVIQLPSAENGYYAAVEATATFEDGRVFVDIGDCSPQSTTPQIAPAALRLASTRAKGRVLRDAINHGEALAEEIPEGSPAPTDPTERPHENPSKVFRDQHCAECGVELTPGQVKVSQAKYQKSLCPDHQRTASN